MNTGIMDPSVAQGAADRAEMHERHRQIDEMRRGLNGANKTDKKAKLREACEGFESVFIQKMWEQMRATLPKDGMMHSKDEKMWQGMYDQELSKKMAGSGGIGLADMMMEQLGKNLEEAAPKTLNTVLAQRREPMPIAPAPLLIGQPTVAPVVEAAPPAPVADIYSGLAPAVAQTPEEPAEPEIDPEFEALVGRIHVEMQQPVVTHTRITTNTSSLDSFDNTRGMKAGGRKNVPRVVVNHADAPGMNSRMTPRPEQDPGPRISPTSVSQTRTEAVATARLPRQEGL